MYVAMADRSTHVHVSTPALLLSKVLKTVHVCRCVTSPIRHALRIPLVTNSKATRLALALASASAVKPPRFVI